MFCRFCGKQLPDNAQFCGYCGKNLRDVSSGNAAVPQQTVSPSVYNAGNSFDTNSVPQAQAQPYAAAGSYAGGAVVQAKKNAGYKRIAIIALAAVLVVVAILLASGLLGGSAGMSNSTQVAARVTNAYQRLFDDGFSQSSLTNVVSEIANCMPQEAIEALMEESNATSQEDLMDELFDTLDISGMSSSFSELMDSVSVSFEIYPGDYLDSDDIALINTQMTYLGIDLTVSAAQELEAAVSLRVLEDSLYGSAGDTYNQDVGYIGLIAIQVDGSWYLWVDPSAL